MLHFLTNKPNVVYINMCNWGERGCLRDVKTSLYGFANEQDVNNAEYAPKLFCL